MDEAEGWLYAHYYFQIILYQPCYYIVIKVCLPWSCALICKDKQYILSVLRSVAPVQ